MANYPFNTGDQSYGPILQSNQQRQQTIWSNRPAQSFYSSSSSNILSAAAVAGGVFASGFIPYKGGRVWDKYVGFLRAAEEYSPGAVLRTFHISTFFSQFQSIPGGSLFVSPEQLKGNPTYADYLRRLIGEKGTRSTAGRLIKEGVTLKSNRLFWGQGQEVALKYASTLRTPEAIAARLQSGLARHLGFEALTRGGRPIPSHQFFARHAPFGIESLARNPTIEGLPAQIIGGRNLAQYGYRQGAMWATEFVDRFNRLLKAPFEMEPFRTVLGSIQKGFSKLTGKPFSFAVKEGTALQMMGRLSWKYGGLLTAGILGYQTADYFTRNSSLLSNTVFSKGLGYGFATFGVKANLLASRAAEITGLHRYREKQEEMAPGSTSLQKLLAFPLIGGFGASIAAYGVTVSKMARLQMANKVDAATARKLVLEEMQSFSGSGPLATLGRQLSKTTGIYARQDFLGKMMRKIATPTEEGELAFKLIGKLGPVKLAGLLGAATGFALITPFLPGAMIPSKGPDELRRIYSGQQDVPIRKGRWWEFGRSPYEGGQTMYYRPHWYARMGMRARDIGIWGSDEGTMSPLEKFYKQEFTYDLERQHYRDRPYPITALPFEDVPLIGPILANTLGRLIKPPIMMHQEEWRQGEKEVVESSPFGQHVATEIGELPPGQAISPYDPRAVIGRQVYNLTEMMGLPGFALTSLKEKLTGSSDLFDQMAQLESSRRMFGTERAYWDLEIGGGLGSTEALRRLYPHRMRQTPLYNPIRNTMPEWLPGPGERGPDFLHGDPFVSIQEGELRLPGAGYAARFPELKGIEPEDYPLIHQYRILADVAPYTNKFDEISRAIAIARSKTETWTEYEEQIYQTTREQAMEKKQKKVFQEYKYLSPMGDITDKAAYYKAGAGDSTGLLATLNKMKATQQEGDKGSVFQRTFGGYWELLSHNAETAFDQLTPISPGAKLVHTRTAIESYEREQVYGTQSAFWQNPVKNFIKPFANLLARDFGFTGIPSEVQRKRDLEQYFDTLEYVKFTRLANLAKMNDDTAAVKEFESKKDQTLFGINPFTYNYTSIFRSMPSGDRDYYTAFSEAQSTEERARVLELVPENEKALYIARWKQQFINDIKQAEKAGILTEEQITEADEEVQKIYDESKIEAMPLDKELWAEYVSTRSAGENYADWYRRTKLLPKYQIPGSDWVGWTPSVDLEDIKLKVVQNLGEDMHDYDLWPDRARALGNKPYINEEAIEPILRPDKLTEDELRSRIDKILLANRMKSQTYGTTEYGKSREGSITLDIQQGRDWSEILKETES